MQHVTLGYTLGYTVFWFGVFGAIKDIPEPPAKREHGLWGDAVPWLCRFEPSPAAL